MVGFVMWAIIYSGSAMLFALVVAARSRLGVKAARSSREMCKQDVVLDSEDKQTTSIEIKK